jgi:PDZ domain
MRINRLEKYRTRVFVSAVLMTFGMLTTPCHAQNMIHPTGTYIGAVLVPISPSPSNDGSGAVKLPDGRTVSVPVANGLYIAAVAPGSPASKSALRAGDAILSSDGVVCSDRIAFIQKIRQAPPGKPIGLTILRKGDTLNVNLTVAQVDPGEPFDAATSLEDVSKEIWTLLPAANLEHMHANPSQLSFSNYSLFFIIGNLRYQVNFSGQAPFYFVVDHQHDGWYVRGNVFAYTPQPFTSLVWKDHAQAARFASAANRLIWEYSPEKVAERQKLFQQKIDAWKASGSKVELPEDAQRHKALAEEAIQEKNFQKAAEEYQAALELYPAWPGGQFNVAVIYGELQDYPDAVAHMKVYLELVPNAPDAEAAQKSIWIWVDKQKSGSN